MAPGSKSDKKKSVTAAELRAMSVDELKEKLAEKSEELMRARFQHATATLENTSLLKKYRRQRARIETVLTEKAQRS